jgi:arylsulfatase A-like enzyme
MKMFNALIALAGMLSLAGRTQDRPNIIFLLTDDQRWDALGCNGNARLKTPNIDELARSGANFRNAFVTTTICCSSRASILSGQYMRTHGIRDFNQPFTAEQAAVTYPALLRQSGYFTGFTGKWGIGSGSDCFLR